MKETEGNKDPRKIEAFKALSDILAEGKKSGLQTGEVWKKLTSALQDIGYPPSEYGILLNQFLAAEFSSSMQGGYTELPDLNTLPEGSRERKRVASFTWWYIHHRVDESKIFESIGSEKYMDHVYKRANFELGNTDEETVDLLKWADNNPGKIVSIFAETIISGELNRNFPELGESAKINDISLLAEFVKKAADGTLVPLNLPEENSRSSAL